MRHLVGKTVTVSLLAFAGQMVAFGVQVVTALLFGARAEVDAYLAAITLPNYVSAVLFSGIGYVFIPIFVEYRTQHHEGQAWQVASNMVTLYLGVAALLVTGGLLLARPLLSLTVPGLSPATLSLATSLAHITWPSTMIGGLLALLTGLYHGYERFRWPALTPVIGSSLNLCVIALWGRTVGVHTLALGVAASNVAQLLLLVAILRGHFRLRLDLAHPGLRRVLRLLAPLMLGALFAQAAVPIERYVASGLPPGSITHLGYASRINLALAALLSGGIAVTFFPTMARHSAEHDLVGLRQSIELGLRTTWLLVAPCVALGAALAHPLIGSVFERGAFTALDTQAVARVLPWYLVALIGFTQGNITARGFYAMKDTRTMSLIAVGEVVAYGLYAPLLSRRLGILGIAAAMSIYGNLSLMIQCAILWTRLGQPPPWPLGFALARVGLAAAAASAVAYLVQRALTASSWLALLGGGVGGILVYSAALYLLRTDEWKMVSSVLRRGSSGSSRTNRPG